MKDKTMENQILSEELHFTGELKLTNDEKNIKKIIEKSIQSAENLKQKLLKSEVTYPNDYVFVSLANRAYEEKKIVEESGGNLHGEKVDQMLGNWRLLTVAYNSVIIDGYVGAAYWNPDAQQVIIAHRGTEPRDFKTVLGTIYSDIQGICLNQHVSQIDSAVTFTDKIITILKNIKQETGDGGEKRPHIQLFFTGHSLGGWLSQITTFTAKYLKRDDDRFIANREFEETGFHACTVIFDSPGGKNMLERIQNKLMNRYGPSYINCLDITSYLSAPNIPNTCNAQTGEVYTISLTYSEPEKKEMQKNLFSYTLLTHKREKFKGVFHPKTGLVFKDENGKLRIQKVTDWPLLIAGDEGVNIRNKVLWSAKQISSVLLPQISGMFSLVEIAHELYSKKKWYDEFKQELNDFFASANVSNNYQLNADDDKTEKNSDRSTRYETQELSENYKNECSINVFTRLEREFLVTYYLLEKQNKDLHSKFEFDFFPSLEGHEELKEKTNKILKDFEIFDVNDKTKVQSENLQEIIPFVKHMLYFFPTMITDIKEAKNRLGIKILSEFYQSGASPSVKSVHDFLETECDILKLHDFFNSSNLKIMHSVMFSAAIGTLIIYKTLKKIENCYMTQQCCGFFRLDRIFYLGDALFIEFLHKVEYKFLAVIECNMYNENVEGFFQTLIDVLKNSDNIKVILVTDKVNDLSKLISNFVENNKSICQEKNVNVSFNDLTLTSKNVLLKSRVIFQGKEVPLESLINKDDSTGTIIDPETVAELASNKMIVIGKPLPSLGETEYYYIDRKLVKNVKVKVEVLKDDTLTDLFAISGVSKEELLKIVKPGMVRTFDEEDTDKSNPVRFITLNKDLEEENFKILCNVYQGCEIHWLNKDNVDLIWKRSHGKSLSGIRRYMCNYETELFEEELLKDNSAIKVVDVNNITNFDEKFIIVAAEPGMGKTTALTQLGTHKGDSEWLIRINLVDYKYKLEQINFLEEGSISKFFHESETVSNTLWTKLLEHYLNNKGNIYLLLDGFDEITAEDQNNVLKLIRELSQTKMQKALISTRLHLRNELENNLSAIAYIFQPLSRSDQKLFLKKFWQNDFDPNINENILDNYINKLLEFVSASIGDKERNFMGIPLQMRMVAEAFRDEIKCAKNFNDPEKSFPENFDMMKLYDRFVYVKYMEYFGKRGARNIDLDEKEDWLITIPTNVHRRLAFKVLFPELEKDFLGNRLPPEESKRLVEKQRINQVGIAQCIGDRVTFIHRSFAEYFVAGILADRLKKTKESYKYKATIKFLEKQFFENANELIKTFLDYHLAKNKIHWNILKGNLEDVILTEENIRAADNLGRTALHYAAQEGHKGVVDRLLTKDILLSTKTDELGKTALHYAARYAKGADIIELLLRYYNSNMNSLDRNGHSAVYYAAQQSNWDMVDYFIEEKGSNVDDFNKGMLLFHFTYKGSLDGVKNVVGEEVAIDIRTDNHGNTLLHIAALKGHSAIVEFFLEHAADVDAVNNSGIRPISYAAEQKNWNIVEFLLRKRSKLNYLSDAQKVSLLKFSSNNLHWDIVKLFMIDDSRDYYFSKLGCEQKTNLLFYIVCCEVLNKTDLEVAKFLIEKVKTVNILDRNNKKPIHYAVENKYWDIVGYLLIKDAVFEDLSDEQKISLLNHSVQHCCWHTVKLFLKSEKRINYIDYIIDKQNFNYLYHIISVGDLQATKSFIERFVERGFNVNTLDSDGKTCLHFAAEHGKLDLVEYLVGVHINVNATDNSETTPLHLAATNGHEHVIIYLVDNKADTLSRDKNDKLPMELAFKNNHRNAYVCLKAFEADMLRDKKLLHESFQSYQNLFHYTRDNFGASDTFTLTVRDEMAKVLFKQGKHDESFEVYKECFDVRQKTLGSDHLDTLLTQICMAEVLSGQGKHNEANEIYNQVFSIQKNSHDYGPNHPDTLETQCRMAEMHFVLDNFDEAFKVFKHVFSIQSNNDLLGPSRLNTLKTQFNMAVVLSRQGKYKDAYKNYEEVYKIRKKPVILGPNHPDTLDARYLMAQQLFHLGEYQKAYQIFKEVYCFQKSIDSLGPNHPDTLNTQKSMARSLYKKGDYKGAYEAYEELFNIQNVSDDLEPHNFSALKTREIMADILLLQEKVVEARSLYKEIFDMTERTFGSEHPETMRAQRQYLDLDLEQAEKMLEQFSQDTSSDRNLPDRVSHNQSHVDLKAQSYSLCVLQ